MAEQSKKALDGGLSIEEFPETEMISLEGEWELYRKELYFSEGFQIESFHSPSSNGECSEYMAQLLFKWQKTSD